MSIYTGNYSECLSGNLISISGDKGRSAEGDKGSSVGFVGKTITELAPKRGFWRIWKDNIGKVPKAENNLFYIRHYYDEVLSKVDIFELLKFEVDPILLCYEKGQDFCHRHVLAEYIEIKYGVHVDDIRIDVNGNITINERPKYIKQMLLYVMK